MCVNKKKKQTVVTGFTKTALKLKMWQSPVNQKLTHAFESNFFSHCGERSCHSWSFFIEVN